jgi:hypothetical protein
VTIRKYFTFDNEPISGWVFLLRSIIGHLLFLFLGIGIWLQASAAFKRAGAFRWRRKYRILSAILIPLNSIVAYQIGLANTLGEYWPDVLAMNGMLSSFFVLFVVMNRRGSYPNQA